MNLFEKRVAKVKMSEVKRMPYVQSGRGFYLFEIRVPFYILRHACLNFKETSLQKLKKIHIQHLSATFEYQQVEADTLNLYPPLFSWENGLSNILAINTAVKISITK